MSTPIEMLELKISCREAALEACESETEARTIETEAREHMARTSEAKAAADAIATEALKAELQVMKESLAKLQHISDNIRGAIEHVLLSEPTTDIEPMDLLKIAVEGNNDSTADPFANGNITAEDTVKLALISMKNTLGTKGLMKMMLKTCVNVSNLGAEGVIKVALETARVSDMLASDVVQVALETAMGSRHMSVKDIITPSVNAAIHLRMEPTLIAKEAFVTAMQRDPERLKTAVLTVLACAMGMGLDSKAIKTILRCFAMETAHGEANFGAGAGAGADVASGGRVTAPSLPPSIPRIPTSIQLKQPQLSGVNHAAGSAVKPPAIAATPQAAASVVGTDRAREMPATIDPRLLVAAPKQDAASNLAPETIVQTDIAQGRSGKRGATEDGQDQIESRASKVVKMNDHGEAPKDQLE